MKNRKQLLIHGGMHKTGSTAIQEVMVANKDLLRSHGILYAQTGSRWDFGVGERHYHIKASMFKDLSGVRHELLWGRLYDEAEAAGCSTVVISHEGFLSPEEPVTAAFEEMQQFFEAQLICYFPDPIEYVNSK